MCSKFTDREIETRLRLDNPWWQAGAGIDTEYRAFPRRAYLPAFERLAKDSGARRAVILMGPRRVGKTILVLQGEPEDRPDDTIW